MNPIAAIRQILNPAGDASPNPPWPLKQGLYMPPRGNILTLPRLAALLALTGGLYYFWWVHLLCRQHRDHVRGGARPIARALAQLIPVYGVYRLHHQAADYARLSENARVAHSIKPEWIAAISAVNWLIVIIRFWPMPADIAQALSAFHFAANIAIALCATLWIQASANVYWMHYVGGRAAERAPFTTGEAAFCVAGALMTLFYYLAWI